MKKGDDHIYLVSSDSAGYLAITKEQLRYRYILQDKDSNICKLSLSHGDDLAYQLEKADSAWIMTEPLQNTVAVDSSQVSSLVTTLIQLQIDDFGAQDVREADYAKYNLDKNCYVFQITQENGDVTTLRFEDYDPLVSSYINCLNEETGEIWRFDSSYVTFLQGKTTTYLLKTVCKVGIDEISAMSIQYNGSYNDRTLSIDTTFGVDYENKKYTCNGTDISTYGDAALTTFQDMFSQVSSLTYTEIQLDSDPPENGTPSLTITYTLKDGTTRIVELVKRDDTTYWARVDGVYTRTVVRQNALSGSGKMLEKYSELMTVISSSAS